MNEHHALHLFARNLLKQGSVSIADLLEMWHPNSTEDFYSVICDLVRWGEADYCEQCGNVYALGDGERATHTCPGCRMKLITQALTDGVLSGVVN